MAGGPAVRTIWAEFTPDFLRAWKRGSLSEKSPTRSKKEAVDRLRPPTESVPSIFACNAMDSFDVLMPSATAAAKDGLPANTLDLVAETCMRSWPSKRSTRKSTTAIIVLTMSWASPQALRVKSSTNSFTDNFAHLPSSSIITSMSKMRSSVVAKPAPAVMPLQA